MCDADLADCCPHEIGKIYPAVAARGADGSWTICHNADCVAHVAGMSYPVLAHGVIHEVDRLDEISFVARPCDPLARLTAVEMPETEVAALPGYGVPDAVLFCERCSGSCIGFTSVEEALGLV